MFVFNFGVESLEQSLKLDRLVILISLAMPFSKYHFFQTDNQIGPVQFLYLRLALLKVIALRAKRLQIEHITQRVN